MYTLWSPPVTKHKRHQSNNMQISSYTPAKKIASAFRMVSNTSVSFAPLDRLNKIVVTEFNFSPIAMDISYTYSLYASSPLVRRITKSPLLACCICHAKASLVSVWRREDRTLMNEMLEIHLHLPHRPLKQHLAQNQCLYLCHSFQDTTMYNHCTRRRQSAKKKKL